MKFTAAVAALISAAGVAQAQGVTSAVAPTASAPAGCTASYDGTFEITVAKVEGAQKRDAPIAKRAECSGDGILVATLSDSVLTDAQSRTGYIASNFQFQFDEPPQAGAIYTAGFSTCDNGSLALGGSAVWYECESGDFYNLYDRNWAAQCSPVEIIVLPCGSTDESGDGQVVGTEIVTTTIVSDLGDGQPQVRTTTTGVPVCQVSQISDGQVQVGTTPCASITTSANTATSTLAPVSQYSDGQIQVTPAASVPTVSSAVETTAPAGETTATAGETTAPAASGSAGSSVTLPSETMASTGASPSGSASVTGGSSTLATSTASSGSSGTSSSASAGTSAPASSGAAPIAMGSLAALVMGLLGAVALF